METEDLSVDKKGYIGIDKAHHSKRLYTLNELVGDGSEGFRLIKWDGRTPTSILNAWNRLIGILAGTPDDNNWPDMHFEAAQALESLQKKCIPPMGKKKCKNCCGPFFALQCSISHGGGQKHPKNLYNTPANKSVLKTLNNMHSFKCIAGFALSVMASHAPLLYEYCTNQIGDLFKKDRQLKKNFLSTIFTTATYNFGPKTVCYEHTNPGNLSAGWCSIMALRPFDHTKGGHLVLWNCRLVIQFPPGSTILLPSTIVAHSNTAIQPGERCYSFAQYSAGALFHWVENSFQRSVDYYGLLTEEEQESVDAVDLVQWKFYLLLLPVIELNVHNPAV